jgi:DNA-directed RNA polymerase delta subunit
MRESLGDKPSSIPANVLKVAMKVCEKKLRDLDDLIDDPTAFAELVTEDEWKVLGADELTIESLAQKKHVDWMAKNEVMQAEKKKQDKIAEDKKKKMKKKKKVIKEEKEDEGEDEEEEEEDIIDDEVDDKTDQEKDVAIAARNPEFKRGLKILDELRKKFP